MKWLLRDALLNSGYLVVVDHLMRPSQALATSIRELMLNWSIPVIAVARSAHMEDVGFVLSLFPYNNEKFGLRNFDPELASEFAATYARREGWRREIWGAFWRKLSSTAAAILERS